MGYSIVHWFHYSLGATLAGSLSAAIDIFVLGHYDRKFGARTHFEWSILLSSAFAGFAGLCYILMIGLTCAHYRAGVPRYYFASFCAGLALPPLFVFTPPWVTMPMVLLGLLEPAIFVGMLHARGKLAADPEQG